jgi:hypothetical protein
MLFELPMLVPMLVPMLSDMPMLSDVPMPTAWQKTFSAQLQELPASSHAVCVSWTSQPVSMAPSDTSSMQNASPLLPCKMQPSVVMQSALDISP